MDERAGPIRDLHWSWLGSVPYDRALELQLETRQGVRAGTGPERLLLLEHPHVYTLGRSASRGDVKADDEWLRDQGVAIVECDRGGQVTYHGPGQLVGYPIVDLDPDRRDVRRYVWDLQEVLVRTLRDLGVTEAEGIRESDRIGVWVGGRKIASIGVHLSRWVTTHGFALNLTTNLSLFGGIIACGLPGVEMTSVEALTGRRPRLPEVAEACAAHFSRVFDRRLVGAAGVGAPR